MQARELEERVRNAIAEASAGRIEASGLRAEARLRGDLGFDSLALVALLARVGDAVGGAPDDVIEAALAAPLKTVADLVALGTRIAPRAEEP